MHRHPVSPTGLLLPVFITCSKSAKYFWLAQSYQKSEAAILEVAIPETAMPSLSQRKSALTKIIVTKTIEITIIKKRFCQTIS